jgi:predicted ABC-type sugar transport system permease subunit
MFVSTFYVYVSVCSFIKTRTTFLALHGVRVYRYATRGVATGSSHVWRCPRSTQSLYGVPLLLVIFIVVFDVGAFHSKRKKNKDKNSEEGQE